MMDGVMKVVRVRVGYGSARVVARVGVLALPLWVNSVLMVGIR